MSWRVAPLGELVDVLDYARIPLSAEVRSKRPGSVPYFGATGQVGTIDASLFDEELVLLGEDGAPFFSRDRPKAYRITGPSWVNNHAHVLRARSGLEARFLLHFLNAFDYRGYANGTTRLKLTQVAMRRIPLPLPDLDEQRRIVDILEDHLSRLDAANASLVTAATRARMFCAAVVRRNTPDSPVLTLGELSSNSGYGTSTKCAPGGPGAAVVRIPNLANGQIDLSDEKRALDPAVDLTRLMLAPGDFLVIRTNGSRDLIGRTAVVQEGIEASFASYLIRYRFRSDRVLPGWVQAMMGTPESRAIIESLAASSAGQYNLSLAKLDSVALPAPPLHEQRVLLARFDEVNRSLSRLVATADSARTRSASLRRALLQAAFSGKLTGSASDADRVQELAAAE